MSPRCAPGRTVRMPRHIASYVRSARRLRLDRRLADVEHAARVAVEAVLDHGDVDVDDVAVLQLLVARDAVAHDVVHRRAQRRGVGRVSRRRVVERRGDRVLHVDHVVVREVVDVARGRAHLDVRREVVEELGREPSRDPHGRDLFRRLEVHRHVRSIKHGGAR